MKYILLIFTLFFSACSVKNYEHTQTKIITIKSPKIKFSDIGYIRNSGKQVELELFMAGYAVEKISVNYFVCVSDGCMSKWNFNDAYLNYAYPTDTLQNILLGKPIYDGQNKVQTEDGFEQNIEDAHVQISYKVSSHATLFKDKKNRIIFNIRDTVE